MIRWSPVLLVVACAEPDVDPVDAPAHELDATPRTTLQRVWAPTIPPAATIDAIRDGELAVTDLDRFLGMGLGVEEAPGLPWIEHRELAPGFVEGAPGERRSLAWFWQLADPQLIDEESPIRFEGFPALYRPSGHLTVQVMEAHVRTARRLSELAGRPLDFAVVAGDLTDGGQRNELDWFVTAMSGGVLDPDSGVDDDPVPGPGNDFNDPLQGEGLGVPWYAALGNHETQYNGGFGVVDEALRAAAVGDRVFDFPLFTNGYRDGAVVDAPVRTSGTTPADPRRVVLYREEVLATLREAPGEPAGHGLTTDDVVAGRGWFSAHPVDGVPLRLVVLDTVNTLGGTGVGASGVMSAVQHAWLVDELDAAAAEHEAVIVVSHHRPADLLGSSEVGGEALRATLAASPNVVLHLCGHIHENLSRFVPGAVLDGGAGYAELTLASTVDFPMQSRVLELVDERNGFLSIYATNVDHGSPEGSLAHEARALGAAKRSFAELGGPEDVGAFWADQVEDQDLLVRLALPADVAAALAAADAPTRVESVETLAAL